MRLGFIVFLFLAGCAAQKPQEQTQPIAKVTTVTPINIGGATPYAYSAYADYLSPLLSNLNQEPFYQLSNPQLLVNAYRYHDQIGAADPRKTIYTFKSTTDDSWGYVTTSVGRSPIANGFVIEGSALGTVYALVLKQTKLCLATQAKGLPVFVNGRWLFNESPGFFECTGLTNTRIYKVGSGLPGLLGPYFDDKDTVFVFRSQGQLQRVAVALKQQFPQLSVPDIRN